MCGNRMHGIECTFHSGRRRKSLWGWKQNALIQVDSRTRKFRYTPEYCAVKHFTNHVASGVSAARRSARRLRRLALS